MPVGAEDYIDQMLVQKYAGEQVDNHDSMVSSINPDKMMSTLNDYGSMSRNMFLLNQQLKTACLAVKSRSAQYEKAHTIENFRADLIDDRSRA